MKCNKLIFVFFIMLIGIGMAEVLVNTSVNRRDLTLNEVGLLNVKLDNDMNTSLKNYTLRIETTDNLVFLESNTKVLLKNIEELSTDVRKEIEIKFKVSELEGDKGKIFVYYGDDGQFVSGTYVNIVNKKIGIVTSKDTKITDEGKETIITIEMNNYSDAPIHGIAIEAIVPEKFNLLTKPVFVETLEHNNSIKREFKFLPPLRSSGKENVTLSYGYFDDKGPHYFEENFNINYNNTNNSTLTLIGLVVLIVAIILYMGKANKPKGVSGTEEKAKEMPEEEKSKKGKN